MSFTGVTVKQISDSKVRVLGTLVGTGTIGLHGATGSAPDVTLPESFKTIHYTHDGEAVSFQDAFSVTMTTTADAFIGVAKTGTTVGDFRFTFVDAGSALTVDIYISYH